MLPCCRWERLRWYAEEAVLQLLLLTRTFEASDPCDVCGALGWWALFAFCSHVLFARTLPYPYGAVLVYSLIPLFILAFKWPLSPLYKPHGGGAMCNDTRRPAGAEREWPAGGEYGSAEPMLSAEEGYSPTRGSPDDEVDRTRSSGREQYGTFSLSRLWLYEADGGKE